MAKKLPPIAYIGMGLIAMGGGMIGYQKLGASNGGSLVYGNTNNQIRVLGDPFSGYSTFRDEGFSEKVAQRGLGVSYQDELDQKARAEALGDRADIIVTTLDQFVQHQPDGKIVGLIDRTEGADAVVLNTKQFPNLTSLNSLSELGSGDLKLVYAEGTPSEYLAKVLDIKFDPFALSDFELVGVGDSAEAYQLLSHDPQVAVAVLWEPDVTKARKDGQTIILSSADVPTTIVDVIAVSNQYAKKHPQKLEAFLAAYYQQMDPTSKTSRDLISQVANDSGLSRDESKQVVSGIHFFKSNEADQWMKSGELANAITATSGILNLTGDVSGFPEPQNMFDPQFLKTAVANRKKVTSAIASGGINLDSPTQLQAKVASASEVKQAKEVGDLSVRGLVEFPTGSSQLTPVGRVTLDKLSTQIKDFNPSTTAILITGHTSKTGSAAINVSLSQSRAQSVATYLKGKGVTLSMATEGKGFSTLLPNVNPTDIRQQRTQITIKRIGDV